MSKNQAASHSGPPAAGWIDSAAGRARMSRVAVTAFLRIADIWGLSRKERVTLLATSPRSIARWSRDPSSARLRRDQFERISYILGIFRGLYDLFRSTPNAAGWVRRPNDHYGGASALDRMLSGSIDDLASVHAYVNAIVWG